MCSQKEYLHGVSVVKVSDLNTCTDTCTSSLQCACMYAWSKAFKLFMVAYVHLYCYDLSFP